MRARVSTLAWLLTIVGCVWDAPTIDGYQCDEHGRCLEGYSCVRGRCVEEGTDASQLIADGAAPTDAGQDAAPTDAARDAGFDARLPDSNATDSARPDGYAADSSRPDGDGLDTAAPDANLTDSLSSDSSRPDSSQPDSSRPDTSQPDTSIPDACTPPVGPSWWDPGYAYRYPISVEAAPADYTLTLGLGGAEAAAVFAQSAAGGDDLRVVHHGSSTSEIDRELYSFSATSVRMRFRIQEPGGYPGGSDTYFLYVGNAAPAAPLQDLHNVYLFFEDFEGFAPGASGSPIFITDPADSWQVVDLGGNHAYLAEGDERRVAEIAGLGLADAWIDVRVRFTGAGSSDHAAVAVRATSLAAADITCFQGELRRSVGDLGISEYTAGARGTQLAVAAMTYSTDQWYDVQVRAVGADARIEVDQEPPVSYTGLGSLGDKIGLYAIYAGALFDDVRVRLRQPSSPQLSLGAEQQPCM